MSKPTMKYEKPCLAYLDDATTAIQGQHGGPAKALSVTDNGTNFMSSTAAGYPAEE